ncbi:MAG TPA: hypothetical protein VER76_11155 [Pyrinomonadaceae bacterium]|nr:hypothetical protein [Pyrinomonadaceae bacterium]
MNCQQFTSLIVEAARGRMMDAAARDAAMRHADACAACGARLAQEQSLTAALRAVAYDMKDLSAPASLEAKLLAAFGQSLAPANAPATATNDAPAPPQTSVQPMADASLRTRRFTRVAMAIAASLVLAALFALYAQFMRTEPSPQVVATKVEPERGTASPHVNTATISTPPPPAPLDMSTAPPEDERPQAERRNVALRAPAKLARGTTPRMITSAQVIDGGNAIIEVSESETARGGAGSTVAGTARPNEPESMTDFISLVADATPTTPLDGGQLVRVQVPRAALASMGLPLNAERGSEPVQADVLVGNDGLARAIRFVR